MQLKTLVQKESTSALQQIFCSDIFARKYVSAGKLGQADKWQPDPANPRSRPLQQIIWLQNLAGWFFTTLFLAGISGLVQQD